MMKHIGVIGGIGPESTIQYYRLIIQLFQEKLETSNYPELTFHCIDLTKVLDLVSAGKLEELIYFLKTHLDVLARAGAEYIAFASNTPHIVFERLADLIDVPLINIATETCRHISLTNIKRVGLLGTKSTMNAGFYQASAKKYGLEILIPSDEEQNYIHEKYTSEIIFNHIIPKTKEKFHEIINKLIRKEKIEGLIVGGTDLPLILKQEDFQDLVLFDTTQIHVASIVETMIKN